MPEGSLKLPSHLSSAYGIRKQDNIFERKLRQDLSIAGLVETGNLDFYKIQHSQITKC